MQLPTPDRERLLGMSPIRYSIGSRIEDAHPEQREAPDFDAFVDDICADRPSEKGKRYLTGPMKANGDGRTHRSKESAEPTSILAVDCDKLRTEQVPKLKAYFGQVEALVHDTASNTAEKPRLRALVHTDRPVTRDEYIAISARIGRDLASMGIEIDASQSRPEQPAYTPLIGAEVWRSHGAPLRVDEVLEGTDPSPPDHEAVGDELHPIPEGHRNVELTSLAGTMRKRRFSLAAILAALLAENETRCTPPLPINEVRRIAASVGRYPPAALLPHRDDDSARLANQWPADLSPDAFHGPLGDAARALNTEADIAAVLVTLLTICGSAIGRGPHMRVGPSRHYANLFCVIVGATSDARKGLSFDEAMQFFELPTQQMVMPPLKPPMAHGLATGEGLISAVRDASIRQDSKNGKTVQIPVAGVTDKRLLVKGAEFAQILEQSNRSGNILSAVLRDAWDSGTLQVLTRADPIKATGAHIAIAAHITPEELRALLTKIAIAAGFGNRFLFVAARRSKELPFGGSPDPAIARLIANQIEDAVVMARQRQEMKFTTAAAGLWVQVYSDLTRGGVGLLGAVTARAAPQVLRLALIYALMDQAAEVELPHLKAALAIWKRCEDSARYIFGSSLGDPLADKILTALRASLSMTRTEISHLLGGHPSKERTDAALDLLRSRGLAQHQVQPTAGGPVNRWSAC